MPAREYCYEAYCLYYSLNDSKIATACTQLPCTQPNVYTLAPASLNAWHHLVFTYDNSTLTFYYDGTLQGSAPRGFTQAFLSGDSVMIGNSAYIPQNNRFFNGTVDDIRFYNCVIKQQEVTSLFTEPNPLSGMSPFTGEVKKIFAYPNPASNLLVFSETGDITLTDVSGKTVMTAAGTNVLDVSSLAPGFYCVMLSRKNSLVGTGKILKE